MANDYYRAVTRALKEANYKHIGNAKGSHEKWECQTTGKIMIVPRNLKSRHTANGIAKDAGLGKLV